VLASLMVSAIGEIAQRDAKAAATAPLTEAARVAA
jgi:hypothetical protein